LITGITRGTTRAHIARATLEAIALQNQDLLEAMAEDLGSPITVLKVDGGAAQNNLLMQLQADISRIEIVRPQQVETTALGAGLLAGLAVGLWDGLDEIRERWKADRSFKPMMPEAQANELVARWKRSVAML